MSEPTEYPPAEAIEAVPEPETETALAVVPHEQAIRPTTTAAQAKVEAVANLTMKAYERAATLTISPEESAALQADFPDEAFKPGAAGKENLIYIEHAYLRDRLTQVFGMGQWAIVPRNRWAEDFTFMNKYNKEVQASRVYVEAMLIIRGCFVGEAVGDMVYYKNNESQNYGDAVEGAKTAALRRCAKEFGIGLQAWKKDWCNGWWERKNAKGRQAPPGRAATASPAATATAKPAPKMATAHTRAVFLQRLGAVEEGPARNHLHSYLVALKWLENEKVVEQLGLWYLPDSPAEFEAFATGLANFSQTGAAVMPYQPHGNGLELKGEPVKEVKPPPAATPPPPMPEPELPPPASAVPGWRDHVFTFGKALVGKKLGDLPEPDILSYAAGFVPRKVEEGYSTESVAAQMALRAALDEAAKELAKQPTKG